MFKSSASGLLTGASFPGLPGGNYHHPHRPIPPIESGRPLLSGFPTYHMPIPTGVFPTGSYGTGTGTGFGPGPTAPISTPLYPTTTYGGSPPVSNTDISPTGITSAPGDQPTCPPIQEITVTETETETATVTVTAGGSAPFPTGTAGTTIGTGSLPVGTGSFYPLHSPYPLPIYN